MLVSPELFYLTLSAIIAVLVTFLVQRYLYRPKIKTSVFFELITADFHYFGKTYALFAPYVFITNEHQGAIYILDYGLELDFGNGFVKLERLYGKDLRPPKLADPLIIPFASGRYAGKSMKLTGFSSKLIYNETKPVRFGDFHRGFLCFVGDPSLKAGQVKRMRFTCTDVFGKKHQTVVTPKETQNMNLLMELTDSELV